MNKKPVSRFWQVRMCTNKKDKPDILKPLRGVRWSGAVKFTWMDSELNADYLIPEPADYITPLRGFLLPYLILYYQRFAPLGLIFWPEFVLPTFRPAGAFFLAGIFATNVSSRWGIFNLTWIYSTNAMPRWG